MARAFLSGVQIPTLPSLNIDGGLTLDAQTGTSGQILTSAGGGTPTWNSSINISGNIDSSGAITAAGNLRSTNSSGDEGGEIFLNKSATNTTLTGGVTIDVWQNRLRFFEQGGNARGFYIDISTGGNSVGTNLVGGGSASNSFATISTPSGTSPVADSSTDTLTLTAGTGITITGDSSADSIAIATNGTASNTNSTLVLRDGSGNFAANQATLVSQKFGTGTGAPSFNSYSGGVRTILYDNIGAASAGYTTGINSGEFWHTTSDTTGSFKWYGGTTLAATLTGLGALTTVGTITAPTFSGSGASLTSLNGSNISSGTVSSARLPVATSTANGVIELFSDTVQSTAANAVTTTASRTYGLQLNSSGQGVINVPWTDTDTNTFPTTWTWTAGTTAGPTASITGTSSTISVASIPAANSTTASGIVTTGAQTFGGVKTMTSPSITTSLTTGSTSFDLLNTTATTVNFAGAATTLNLGTGSIAKTINLGTASASATTVNIGTSATSSSTINLQAPFVNVGRVTSSTGSITGVNTFIEAAETSTSGASATVTGGNLYITGGAANQEDEFNTASVKAGDVYIDGGSIATINGVQTKGRVYVGSNTDTGSVNIGRTGITTTVTGTLSNSGNTTTTGSLTRSALSGGGSTTATFDNSGNLVRTSSSERYKESITDAEYLYSDVIALQPKTFRLKSEVEENENARVYGGFIAEDVDQLESLKPFVNYLTTENGDKIPDGIQYGEMVAALVSALKHQDTIIKSLETRIQALESN